MSTLDDFRMDSILDLEKWTVEFRSTLNSDKNKRDNKPLLGGHVISLTTNYWAGKIIRKEIAPIRFEAVAGHIEQVEPLYRKMVSIIELLIQGEEMFSVPEFHLKPLEPIVFREPSTPIFVDGATPLQIQDMMLGAGWGYCDSISYLKRGDTSLTRRVEFSRWDWHGEVGGSPVGFCQFGSVNANWESITEKLAKSVLKIWDDFPTSIPSLINGRIVEDKFKTEVFFGKS